MIRSRAAPRLVLLAAVFLTAAANPPSFEEARQHDIAQQLDAKPELTETYQRCPADIFRRNAPFWQRFVPQRFVLKTSIPYQLCEKNPADCIDRCFAWHNGDACFALARAFQENSPDNRTSRQAEMLFSEACAAGDPAGCVNRAAGIRNGTLPDDPFAPKDSQTKQACEYRSFQIGCNGNDAWGCAMLGQSYGNGEGTQKDPVQALQKYARACKISPNFAACNFAKSHMLSPAPETPTAP